MIPFHKLPVIFNEHLCFQTSHKNLPQSNRCPMHSIMSNTKSYATHLALFFPDVLLRILLTTTIICRHQASFTDVITNTSCLTNHHHNMVFDYGTFVQRPPHSTTRHQGPMVAAEHHLQASSMLQRFGGNSWSLSHSLAQALKTVEAIR